MDIKYLHRLLNHFSPLSDAAFHALVGKMVYKKFARGVDIISPGQVQQELFFIQATQFLPEVYTAKILRGPQT